MREDARAWWSYEDASPATDDDPYARFKRPYHCWETSRAHIANIWAEHGPFHGICGFSQGAVVTHQLLREAEGWSRAAGDASLAAKFAVPQGCEALSVSPPAFAVLVCGFPARHGPALPPSTSSSAPEASKASSYLLPPGDGFEGEPHLWTPSLHCIGEGDITVAPALQRELAACFEGPEVLSTDKGHAMPQKAADLAAVIAFAKKHATQLKAK